MVVELVVAVAGRGQVAQHLLAQLARLVVHLLLGELAVGLLDVAEQLLLLLYVLAHLLAHRAAHGVQLVLDDGVLVVDVRTLQRADELGRLGVRRRRRVGRLHLALEHLAHIAQRVALVQQATQVLDHVRVLEGGGGRGGRQRGADLVHRLAEERDAVLVLLVLGVDDLVGLDGVLDDLLVLADLGVQVLGELTRGRARPLVLELRAQLGVGLLLLGEAALRLGQHVRVARQQSGQLGDHLVDAHYAAAVLDHLALVEQRLRYLVAAIGAAVDVLDRSGQVPRGQCRVEQIGRLAEFADLHVEGLHLLGLERLQAVVHVDGHQGGEQVAEVVAHGQLDRRHFGDAGALDGRQRLVVRHTLVVHVVVLLLGLVQSRLTRAQLRPHVDLLAAALVRYLEYLERFLKRFKYLV